MATITSIVFIFLFHLNFNDAKIEQKLTCKENEAISSIAWKGKDNYLTFSVKCQKLKNKGLKCPEVYLFHSFLVVKQYFERYVSIGL
jgi:hypothetical protein